MKNEMPPNTPSIQLTDEQLALLSLSGRIAAIRNKKELEDILTGELANFIHFDDLLITIYSPAQKNDEQFVYLIGKNRTTSTAFKMAMEGLITAEKFRVPFIAAGPALISIADYLRHDEVLPCIRILNETGIRELAAAGLYKDDAIFGCLYLFSETAGQYTGHQLAITKAVANLIAIAVINIMAADEVVKKETENTVLLSLSNAIALIRNKADLFQVIDRQLKKIIPFDDFVICLINDDQQTHSAFLYNETESFQRNPGVAPKAQAKYSLNDGLCHKMITAKQPMVFKIADIMQWPDPPAWMEFWHNLGIKEMVAFAILDRDTCVGFFYLYARQHNVVSNKYYNLLKSIGLQISVAVSNIKANEKIEAQLLEINTYKQQLEDEKLYLQEQIATSFHHGEIVGKSPQMENIFHLVNQVAASDSTVLILGETGTGKELIARAIHNASPRKDKMMIKLNCATLPANLTESELFGHEKGSFTGATERRIGKFELANNSTLFLDEIGELSLELQVKLLRALQEKEIERIGGRGVIKIDVRIITATNRNLFKEVQAGTFRSDLYYRLNVFPIMLPPLRERRDDIGMLAAHFVSRYAKKTGKSIKNISQQVLKNLAAYNWPGNIRELEHLIERSVLLAKSNTISEVSLPKNDFKEMPAIPGDTRIKSIAENERDHILNTLKVCQGKISGTGGAAELLGIPATTLNSKIKKFSIKREHILK